MKQSNRFYSKYYQMRGGRGARPAKRSRTKDQTISRVLSPRKPGLKGVKEEGGKKAVFPGFQRLEKRIGLG